MTIPASSAVSALSPQLIETTGLVHVGQRPSKVIDGVLAAHEPDLAGTGDDDVEAVINP